jgi:hypothetical protein
MDVDVVMMTFQKKVFRTYILDQPASLLHRKIATPIHSHRMVFLPSGGKLCHSYCEDVSKSVCSAPGPKRDQSTGEHVHIRLLLGQVVRSQICSERICSRNCETVLQ